MSTQAFTTVESERRGSVLWLTLNRPEAANAINSLMHAEIRFALSLAATDEEVRAIVVTGAGERVFCGGVDIRNEPPGAQRTEDLARTLMAVLDSRKPVVSAVNGVASEGGLMLALATDLLVASDRASFVLSEIDVGITCFPGIAMLSLMAGSKVATDLALTGRRMGAVEAERRGLVAVVAPAGELVDRAQELARALGDKPPTALALDRWFLNGTLREALQRAVDAMDATRAELLASGEPQAAAAAFFARRRESAMPAQDVAEKPGT